MELLVNLYAGIAFTALILQLYFLRKDLGELQDIIVYYGEKSPTHTTHTIESRESKSSPTAPNITVFNSATKE